MNEGCLLIDEPKVGVPYDSGMSYPAQEPKKIHEYWSK